MSKPKTEENSFFNVLLTTSVDSTTISRSNEDSIVNTITEIISVETISEEQKSEKKRVKKQKPRKGAFSRAVVWEEYLQSREND